MSPKPEKDLTETERYWRDPSETPFKLFRAWMSMTFSDHGFLRAVLPNRYELAPGVWRSSQPSPSQIRWFAKQGGKTILTLRGHDYRGAMFLERKAAKDLGLTLIHWRCRSDFVVDAPQIQALIDLLRSIEKPVLIHCKSGADRMGFVSVVYRHVIMGDPIETAMEQLSGKYLHLKSSKTGVLDYFFEVYAAAHNKTGIDFETWLATECDTNAINRDFQPNGFVGWFERKILRRE